MSTTTPNDTVHLTIFDGRPLHELPAQIADQITAKPWTTGYTAGPDLRDPTHVRRLDLVGDAFRLIREGDLEHKLFEHEIPFNLFIFDSLHVWRPGMPFIARLRTTYDQPVLTLAELGHLLRDLAAPDAPKKARNAAARDVIKTLQHLVLATTRPRFAQRFPADWSLPEHLSIDDIPF